MAFAGSLFRFFIFSNLFISCCATAMAWLTCDILGLPVNSNALAFIFFATLCSYSFHWMLTTEWLGNTPRSNWQKSLPFIHPLLLVAAMAGTAWFGWKLAAHWPFLLLVAFLTFLYSAPKIPHPFFLVLRRIALGKTLFLTIVWTMVTTLLPVIDSGRVWPAGTLLFLLNRFFLIYAICILFDLRDVDYDRKHGIRSLITWLSADRVRQLFFLSILLFMATGTGLLAFGQDLLPVTCLLVPGIITAFLYRRATTDRSDLLFYFVLDGLMALPAALLALFDNLA
ncbi:MAG: hypothetical protein EOO05_03625 [Chitinophagaceae bacterium]|nr:MAG: hypothetical protein EOO05_03625 [Chitinophagaceae bacterium]